MNILSQATNQTVGLLALISGSIKTIYDFRLAPELDALVLYTIEVTDELIKHYPVSGTEKSMRKFVESRMLIYDQALKMMPKEKYSAVLLTAMGVHICDGLLNRIGERKKRAIIEPIKEALEALLEGIDPKGLYVEQFDRGNHLVKIAYQIFEFDPQWEK